MVVGLIRGRHNLPPHVTQYIWQKDISDVTDIEGMEQYAEEWVVKARAAWLTVYVTGLTQALVAVIKACYKNHVPLMLMHYNRKTKDYFKQRVF